MIKNPQCEAPKMIKFTPFEEYSKKYEHLFKMSRTDNGVVTARFFNEEDNGSAYWDYPLHRGIGQLCHDIGQDADTTALIIGGWGDEWLRLGPTSLKEDFETRKWALYEHSYYDGCNMVEGLVNDVEQPTIGVVTGLCVHSEIALLCDITLMAEDAVICDPHFAIGGTIPGDGIQVALQYLVGPKRANYMMMFGEKITAQRALELGLVNEVLPKDKVFDRAQELADAIAKQPRITTRLMSQTLRGDLKARIARDLRPTFGTEMWNMLSTAVTHDEAFDEFDKVNEKS